MREGILKSPGVMLAETEDKFVPRQLDGVQILRGIAAALVVFSHYCLVFIEYGGKSSVANYHSMAYVGASGVDIFFCISGFVIIYSLRCRVKRIGWKTFFFARVKRIVPLYWLFTMAMVAMWATGYFLKKLIVTPDLIFKSLMFMPVEKSFVDGQFSVHPIVDQGWTLQYEALFYICCTIVIALVGSKRVFPWAPFAVACLALISLFLPAMPAYFHDPLMLEFVGGTVLGWLAATGRLSHLPYPKRIAWGSIFLGILSLFLSIYVPNPENFRVVIWGVPGFFIVLGSILINPRRGSRVVNIGIFLGAASYSIYLGHGFATLFVGTLMKNGYLVGAGDIILLALVVVTVFGTSLIYVFVERPIGSILR